jgi:hypothetical protein
VNVPWRYIALAGFYQAKMPHSTSVNNNCLMMKKKAKTNIQRQLLPGESSRAVLSPRQEKFFCVGWVAIKARHYYNHWTSFRKKDIQVFNSLSLTIEPARGSIHTNEATKEAHDGIKYTCSCSYHKRLTTLDRFPSKLAWNCTARTDSLNDTPKHPSRWRLRLAMWDLLHSRSHVSAVGSCL